MRIEYTEKFARSYRKLLEAVKSAAENREKIDQNKVLFHDIGDHCVYK